MGGVLAARAYPSGYDWAYTVASALASRKHNPAGSIYFAGGLVVGMFFLSVAICALRERLSTVGRFFHLCLWVGVTSCGLVGLERLFFYHLSEVVDKGHEVLALLAFLGFYLGVSGMLFRGWREKRMGFWPTLLLLLPLCAIAFTQLWLYIDQRDFGWVDPGWRDLGVPVWLSFAFWQWLAMGGLWAALGVVIWKS